MSDQFSHSDSTKHDSHGVHRIYMRWPSLAREGFSAHAELPKKGFRKACVLGMGGSAAGGDIIASWLTDRSDVELSVFKGQLPVRSMEGTLAIACSASGETVETIDMLQAAHSRGANLVCISGGGSVEKVAGRLGVPHIRMPEVVAPRYMLPFIVFSCLSVLNDGLGLECEKEVKEAFTAMDAESKGGSLEARAPASAPKQIATALLSETPAIYGTRFTRGVGVRFKNVLNENAKKHAFFDGIPDVFHNEVESWEFEVDGYRPVFLRHSKDPARDSTRADTLISVLAEKGAKPLEVRGSGKGGLAQLMSMAYRLDLASYFIAVGLGRDPFPTGMIDLIKKSQGTT